MSNGMKKRMIWVLAVVAVGAVMLACSAGTLIGRRAEPTSTPTKTPRPTFTITPTPTDTPIPTHTPTPTFTPTPVTPTNTPLVLTATPTSTDTPVPPTDTPVPPTNTPKPTARPKPKATATPTKKPGPTNTPVPTFPFRKTDARGWPNCGTTGVKVFFKHRDGSIYPGLQFAVYVAGGGCIGVSKRANEVDGSIDFILGDYGPRPGAWEVQVVETSDGSDGEAACNKITRAFSERVPIQTTDKPCAPDTSGVQWVWLWFQEN